MSKKSFRKLDLFTAIQKGREFYDEYRDTIVSFAKSFKQKKMSDKAGSVRESLSYIKKFSCIKDCRAGIESDDSFNESLSTLESAVRSVSRNGITSPAEIEMALRVLGEVAQETIQYTEAQETKREEIRAMRDHAIAKINAMSDCVKEYLEKTFDERAHVFQKQFEIVNTALVAGDNEMLAMSLNSII